MDYLAGNVQLVIAIFELEFIILVIKLLWISSYISIYAHYITSI